MRPLQGRCAFEQECSGRALPCPTDGKCGWFVPVAEDEKEHTVGRASLEGMLEQVDTDVALGWHLQYNHYPPIPSVMVDACKAAIAAASDGDWEQEIELPEGVTYKDCGESCPAWALIEHAHLHGFIEMGEDYE